MSDNNNLLQVKDLTVIYQTKNAPFTAVKNVSFSIEKGKTLGLVGESGCGKSTIGKCLLGLVPYSKGIIKYSGQVLKTPLPRQMQMIFQDPYGSLNPRMTIENIVAEALDIHKLAKGIIRQGKILELMDWVGLPRSIIKKYPKEISGGQKQRVGIARALSLNPEFIFCDEPTSSLDAHHQNEIISLLRELQKELQLTYLFVSHDLPLVKVISHDVAVMYKGEIVELAESENLYKSPKHSYTKNLISSVPIPDPKMERSRNLL
ncbi:MAG: ATP-binding cassette domain-containing protein [Chlamydiota bacterium]|nr:ATP-binding cassette domain-containing protein [Chlamydiota bacterium]